MQIASFNKHRETSAGKRHEIQATNSSLEFAGLAFMFGAAVGMFAAICGQESPASENQRRFYNASKPPNLANF